MCIFIKHITCVGLRTNQAEKMRLSIWHMWRFEAKVAIVKRANESGGLQKAAAAGPEFPALGNWRHFVKNLSRPVKLSAAHPPSYEAKTCQTVRTAYNQERPPQNGGEEGKICKYGCGAGLAPENFEVWWTAVVRRRQFEGLPLTYSGSTFELNLDQNWNVSNWLSWSSKIWWVPIGVKIMFKATIRWWSGRLADHGKILFLPISSLEKFLFDQKYLYSGPSNLLPDHFHLW